MFFDDILETIWISDTWYEVSGNSSFLFHGVAELLSLLFS